MICLLALWLADRQIALGRNLRAAVHYSRFRERYGRPSSKAIVWPGKRERPG